MAEDAVEVEVEEEEDSAEMMEVFNEILISVLGLTIT